DAKFKIGEARCRGFDYDIVESFLFFLNSPISNQAAVQHRAFVDEAAAFGDAREMLVEFRQRDLGQESKRTEVDGQEWDTSMGEDAGRSQQRAVAAQHDGKLGIRSMQLVACSFATS